MVPHFFSEKKVGAVTSVVRVNNNNGIVQQIQDVEYCVGFGLYNTVLSEFDSLFVTPGPLSLYSKKALEETKGFDTNCLTEDMEITFHLHKLGYRVFLEPNAQVYSDVPDTIPKLFKQRARWSRGGLYTAYKYRKDFLSPKHLFFRLFFPMKLTLELSAVIFLFLLIRLLQEWVLGWGYALNSLYSIAFEAIPLPDFYLSASLIFFLIMVCTTAILVYFGAAATGRKTRELSVPGIALFVLVYGSFIVGVYFYSLSKAVIGVSEKW
jgi:biofilm PGA synthesis N-glycosyltransferase PgaC